MLRVNSKLFSSIFRRSISEISTSQSQISAADNGKLLTVPTQVCKDLQFQKILPSKYIAQMNTLGECTWMIREHTVELLNLLGKSRLSFPSVKFVLWGKFGTGKTMTICQALQWAHEEKWAILNIRSVMDFTRRAGDIQMSSFKEGRIDTPEHAVKILNMFKLQNQHIWGKLADLKTEKEYVWTKVDKTAGNRPITEIIEMGLSAPFVATDCFGALVKELKRHSTNGGIKLLVAIDEANSMYGKSIIKRSDGTKAMASDLSLVHHLKQFLKNDWTNGATVLVADEKELKDARDSLTVPLITPLELFGEVGFGDIDPFVPIETKNYTKAEIEGMYEYYVSKNWVTTPKAQTEQGKKELIYLSAFNPYYFERNCAFV
uniref:28S ribosomal protein S29, mitochondrial n=1 Tax=Rhabditophanes sp. KR3021 TaxID=114890 RepID=A0AC35U397_9BILA